MKLDINRIVILITAFMTIAFIATGIFSREKNPLPDFTIYKDVKEKKDAFFSYILPLVEEQNNVIKKQREKLLELKHLSIPELSRAQEKFVKGLARQYRVDTKELTKDNVKTLLHRVDLVPASLALAQAAMESAWGTSRFAVQANNLFGQWCYTKGCGLVPLRRNTGSSHEVEKFLSVSDAISSYMRNINTHRAYRELRDDRASLRKAGEPVAGHELAEGLIDYSELREAYVHEIQAVIRINKLAQYDVPAQ
jgi:Bax protein